MNLEQARIYLERITNSRISNNELCLALDMKKSNLSRKLKEKSKLRECHKEALEKYYNLKFPNNVEELLEEASNNYSLLEDIIVKVLNYTSNSTLPIKVTDEKKAKLITTLYRMVQYNAVEVNDTLIENLLRLTDN
ncbi:hypothetical protein IJE86_11595 [bacterium]|nr:hypothetical protein [bacterium]